jgi:pimeloyl-ACP methyl ester carboxylesterase
MVEPVVFCGLSMGGYVGWQFWRRHRHRLRAFILCDTRAVADTPEAAQTREETAERVLREGPGVVADAMLPKLFAADTFQRQAAIVEETRKVIMETSPDTLAAALRGMARREDFRPRLAEVDVPTLLICGQHDAISAVAEMQHIAAAIAGARLAVIPQAGHMAPLEQPQLVNRAMQEFLREVCE